MIFTTKGGITAWGVLWWWAMVYTEVVRLLLVIHDGERRVSEFHMQVFIWSYGWFMMLYEWRMNGRAMAIVWRSLENIVFHMKEECRWCIIWCKLKDEVKKRWHLWSGNEKKRWVISQVAGESQRISLMVFA